MAISKEAIVDASIEIMNRDGVENLTMRTIAKELGIKAASLYWHVNGKLELYGAIAERLCFLIEAPRHTDDTKEYLRESFKAYRTMLLSTRDAVSVMENSIPNTPKRMEIIEATAGALLKIGIRKENLTTVANLFNNYVLSFVADETRFKNTPPETYAGFSGASEIFTRPAAWKDSDYDDQFLYGLNVLFAGLEAMEASV